MWISMQYSVISFQLWWHFVQHAEYKCEIQPSFEWENRLWQIRTFCKVGLLVQCCVLTSECFFFGFCLHSHSFSSYILIAWAKRNKRMKLIENVERQQKRSPNFPNPDFTISYIIHYIYCLFCVVRQARKKNVLANSFYNQLLLFTFVWFCRFCCCCWFICFWMMCTHIPEIEMVSKSNQNEERQRESETNECNIQTSWSWFATSKRAHVLEFCYVYIFVCVFFCVSIYFNAKVMSKFVYLCQNFLYNFRWIFGFWERCGKLICFKRKWIHGDFSYLFLSFCFPFVVKCHEPINQCDSQININ